MKVKRARTTLLLVSVAICVVAACSVARAADISVAVEPQSARKPAPDFVLLDTSGKSVPLSSFKGKPLLLETFGPPSAEAASKKSHHSLKFTTPMPKKALPWLGFRWTSSTKI